MIYKPAGTASVRGSRVRQHHLRLEDWVHSPSEPLLDSTRIRALADDEQIIADTLAAILNASGFEARAAYSGKTAVGMPSTST